MERCRSSNSAAFCSTTSEGHREPKAHQNSVDCVHSWVPAVSLAGFSVASSQSPLLSANCCRLWPPKSSAFTAAPSPASGPSEGRPSMLVTTAIGSSLSPDAVGGLRSALPGNGSGRFKAGADALDISDSDDDRGLYPGFCTVAAAVRWSGLRGAGDWDRGRDWEWVKGADSLSFHMVVVRGRPEILLSHSAEWPRRMGYKQKYGITLNRSGGKVP